MTSAIESFVVQLARAAKRGSRHLRGLAPEDRDDVISAATLWCWEHREEFDQHVQPLEQWFADRLKAARRTRGKTRGAKAELDTLVAEHETERDAMAAAAYDRLATALSPHEQRIVTMLYRGLTVKETAANLGVSRSDVRGLQRRLRQLLDLPVSERPVHLSRLEDPGEHPLSDEADRPPTRIDYELARMISGPRMGKECPPCWRCTWFYGLLPAPGHFRPSQIVDLEVRAAVREVEKRKIEIANRERAEHVLEFDFPFVEVEADE